MVHEITSISTSTGGGDTTPPLFYVMARGLEQKYLDAIEYVLQLTPCQAVVISDLLDASVAWNFAPMVMRADTDFLALTLAREMAIRTGRPVLVIGKAQFLDAIFRDGHIERIELQTPVDA